MTTNPPPPHPSLSHEYRSGRGEVSLLQPLVVQQRREVDQGGVPVAQTEAETLRQVVRPACLQGRQLEPAGASVFNSPLKLFLFCLTFAICMFFKRAYSALQVDVYEVLDSRVKPWRGNLITTRLVPLYTQGWEVFNVTQTVRLDRFGGYMC